MVDFFFFVSNDRKHFHLSNKHIHILPGNSIKKNKTNRWARHKGHVVHVERPLDMHNQRASHFFIQQREKWHQFFYFWFFFVSGLFTSPGLNVDGDTLGRSCVEIHKNRGEGGVDDEGDQEEEGEEAEGAKEDEERGGIEQQLL